VQAHFLPVAPPPGLLGTSLEPADGQAADAQAAAAHADGLARARVGEV